jgi:hypothetical protein
MYLRDVTHIYNSQEDIVVVVPAQNNHGSEGVEDLAQCLHPADMH